MYRHILIPTDGSELAERGVSNGLALAKSLGARVTVLIVKEPFDTLRFIEVTGEADEHAEEAKRHAAGVLDRAASAAKRAGVACDTIQVEHEHPYQAIIAVAKDRACDLIVMSSHGRSGFSAVVLGSVTNKVLTTTKSPVLVCH